MNYLYLWTQTSLVAHVTSSQLTFYIISCLSKQLLTVVTDSPLTHHSMHLSFHSLDFCHNLSSTQSCLSGKCEAFYVAILEHRWLGSKIHSLLSHASVDHSKGHLDRSSKDQARLSLSGLLFNQLESTPQYFLMLVLLFHISKFFLWNTYEINPWLRFW